MKDKKHEKRVLNHLKKWNFITRPIAEKEYGVGRLSSVVHRLRNGNFDGINHDIKCEMMDGLNVLKEPCKYGRYSLHKVPNFKLEA